MFEMNDAVRSQKLEQHNIEQALQKQKVGDTSMSDKDKVVLISAIKAALFTCAFGREGAGVRTQNSLMAPVGRDKFHDGNYSRTNDRCLKEAAELVIDAHTVLLEGMPRQDLEQIWKARAARLSEDYDVEIHSENFQSQSL